MDYKCHSIELTTKASSVSGKISDVIYTVRRSGDPAIVFSGAIGRDFRSDGEATEAALTKARDWIDQQSV
jgi:hypothetical protein